FVCSKLLVAAGETPIENLGNNQLYRFWVVTIDKVDNPSDPVYLGEGTPCLEENFWERYERQGGKAQGCAMGTTHTWSELQLPGLLLFALGLLWIGYKTHRRKGGKQ
ncbi:MAG: hypothetical protein V1754_09590, partial [Pseudomonadota bacterium]